MGILHLLKLSISCVTVNMGAAALQALQYTLSHSPPCAFNRVRRYCELAGVERACLVICSCIPAFNRHYAKRGVFRGHVSLPRLIPNLQDGYDLLV